MDQIQRLHSRTGRQSRGLEIDGTAGLNIYQELGVDFLMQ
jgi:hypothetical protein